MVENNCVWVDIRETTNELIRWIFPKEFIRWIRGEVFLKSLAATPGCCPERKNHLNQTLCFLQLADPRVLRRMPVGCWCVCSSIRDL